MTLNCTDYLNFSFLNKPKSVEIVIGKDSV
jgi:hypothetical protein